MFVFLRIVEDDSGVAVAEPDVETLPDTEPAPVEAPLTKPRAAESSAKTRRTAKKKAKSLKGRVCTRVGCGKRLKTKFGDPDYRRHFCSKACRRADGLERLRLKRKGLGNRRCPLCGHQASLGRGVRACVSRNTRRKTSR